MNRVNFTLGAAETLGLIGESGSGKTTLARCILRILRPTSGAISFRTRGGVILELAGSRLTDARSVHTQLQLVPQDAQGGLNPRMNVLELVGEPLTINEIASGSELRDRVAETIRLVGLDPSNLHRRPEEFSGGERQRLAIARALVTNPSLIVADEPVSHLDPVTRIKVMELLLRFQQDNGCSYIFIAHDLHLLQGFCGRIGVMHEGNLVEMEETDRILSSPAHEATRSLVTAARELG